MLVNHKPCPICGNPMHRQSKKCWDCYINESHVDKVEMTCKKCGKKYMVHKTQIKYSGAKYCSMSCARSGSPTRKITKPTVECSNCGKRFKKYKSEIKKNHGGKHFCSPECWYLYNQRDHHYLWGGGQNERLNQDSREWKKAIRKRDRKQCRICHSATRLEIHHIYPYRDYPDKRWSISNGITLCHSCHKKMKYNEMEYADILCALIESETPC